MSIHDEYDDGRGEQKPNRSIPGAGGWAGTWNNLGLPIGINWHVLGLMLAGIAIFAILAVVGFGLLATFIHIVVGGMDLGCGK